MSPINLVATLVPLLVVAAGLIGWVTTLRSDVTSMENEMESIHLEVGSLKDNLKIIEDQLHEIEKRQDVSENEMRTIMSDHSGFADVLKELGKSGVLPSGERRAYGGY